MLVIFEYSKNLVPHYKKLFPQFRLEDNRLTPLPNQQAFLALVSIGEIPQQSNHLQIEVWWAEFQCYLLFYCTVWQRMQQAVL